jgi:hypothetical protein
MQTSDTPQAPACGPEEDRCGSQPFVYLVRADFLERVKKGLENRISVVADAAAASGANLAHDRSFWQPMRQVRRGKFELAAGRFKIDYPNGSVLGLAPENSDDPRRRPAGTASRVSHCSLTPSGSLIAWALRVAVAVRFFLESSHTCTSMPPSFGLPSLSRRKQS